MRPQLQRVIGCEMTRIARLSPEERSRPENRPDPEWVARKVQEFRANPAIAECDPANG